MKKNLTLIIFCSWLASAFGQIKTLTSDIQRTIWVNFFTPLIHHKQDSVLKYVNFPLLGDWGAMMGYKGSPKHLTKDHFKKGYDTLFTKEFIEKAKKMSFKDIISGKHVDGIEYLFMVGFEKIIDGFKDESAIILRFKEINGIYKLYLIQGAG